MTAEFDDGGEEMTAPSEDDVKEPAPAVAAAAAAVVAGLGADDVEDNLDAADRGEAKAVERADGGDENDVGDDEKVEPNEEAVGG